MQEELNKLLVYWFPRSSKDGTLKYQGWWFDGSRDNEIFEKFGDLLQKTEQNMPDFTPMQPREKFGYIILLDQITRNVTRYKEEIMNIVSDSHRNDPTALTLAKDLILHHDTLFCFTEIAFILLPFRHSRQIENMHFVSERLEEYKNNLKTDQEKSFFKRFFQATLSDYGRNYPDSYVLGKSCEQHPLFDRSIHDKIFGPSWKNYLLSFLGLSTIEQRVPSKEFNKEISKHPLYKSIVAFVENNNIKRIGVSLSGGVDSNVMLYILYQMSLENKIEFVGACHLDYGNRETSKKEATYLEQVCGFYGIPYISRRIDHMKREDVKSGKIDRNFYESKTKEIRFAMYEYATELWSVSGWCLGHHNDDLKENVLMNIFGGKSILDLFVMKESMKTQKFCLLRPMLEHDKSDIYDIAHKHNILYFIDITPETHLRGFIRKKIIPMLFEFDSDIPKNLIKVGHESNNWNVVIDNQMKNIISKVQKKKLGFILPFDHTTSCYTKVFWSALLAQMFHGMGIHMISEKNLKLFCDWISSEEKKKSMSMIMFSNGFNVILDSTNIYFFETNKLEKIQSTTITLENETIHTVINRWTIKISKTEEDIRSKMTYNDFIDGKFTYTEALNEASTFEIKTFLDKSDCVRKIFSQVSILSQYVPKVTSGINNDPVNFVKIELTCN